MKITLVQQEIEEAIQDYMNKSLILSEDKSLKIDVCATRGPAGVTAEITIESSKNQTPIKEPVPFEEPKEPEVIQEEEEEKPVSQPIKKSFFANLS